MKRFTRTMAVAVAAASLTGGLAAFGASPASAAPNGALIGTLTVSPPTGLEQGQFTATVNANCPANTGSSGFYIDGPGIAAVEGQPLSGEYPTNGVGTFTSPGDSFANLKTAGGGFTANADYVLSFKCFDDVAFLETARYSTIVSYTFAPNGLGTYTTAPPVVPGIATSTVLTGTPASPVVSGTSVTFSADVTPATGPDAPVGTVEFFNGASSLGAGSALSATGVSTLTTTALPVAASNSITAVFTPGAGFSGSTSNALVYSVTGAPVAPVGTSSVLSVAPVAPTANSSTTLTCTISPATGTTAPTGSVTFTNGTATIASNVPVVNGVASFTTFALGAQTAELGCAFVGTAPFTNSTAAPVTVVIGAATGSVDEQTVTVEIPAGAIVITTPYFPDNPLFLGVATLDQSDSTYSASANFNNISITDTRAGNLGFTASLVAGPFTNGAASFPGDHAGLTGVTASQVPGNALSAGNVQTFQNTPFAPGLGTPKVFATYASGLSLGTAALSGVFGVDGVPTSVAAGLYTSTVTFTAV